MLSMLKRDFWYDLPKELIAQEPACPRDAARLMVLNQKDDSIQHRIFRDLPEYLEPGDLLVISMSGIMDVSTGGDLLALRAQLRGVQGELTDGCLRDTDDIAAFGFPAYSAGTAPNKSAYDIETVGVDVPVTLCGVLIFPGDMVVMDRTGVVVVPSGKIAEVYESASRIAKREERVAVHLREGKTLTESRKLAAAEVGQ